MKTKKIDKRLALKKTTLVNLDTNEQRNIYGGISDTDCKGCETAWDGSGCDINAQTFDVGACMTDFDGCLFDSPEF